MRANRQIKIRQYFCLMSLRSSVGGVWRSKVRRDSDMALFKYFSRVPTLPAKVPSLSEKELERTNADVKQNLPGNVADDGIPSHDCHSVPVLVVTSFSLAWQFFPHARRPCILVDVKSSNTAFDCQFHCSAK